MGMTENIELRDDFIGIFDGFFPYEMCDKYILWFKKQQADQLTWQRVQTKNIVQDESVDTDGLFLSNFAPVDEENNTFFSTLFFEKIAPLYFDYYPGLSKMGEKFYISATKVQKTEPGQGYHVWHCEHGPYQPSRILAWTLYLNDGFEGGETEFLHQNVRVTPKKGRLALFPSHFTHLHRGNPPLTGTKYIQTGWVCMSV